MTGSVTIVSLDITGIHVKTNAAALVDLDVIMRLVCVMAVLTGRLGTCVMRTVLITVAQVRVTSSLRSVHVKQDTMVLHVMNFVVNAVIRKSVKNLVVNAVMGVWVATGRHTVTKHAQSTARAKSANKQLPTALMVVTLVTTARHATYNVILTA